jgi:hypothetical protein
MDYYYTEVSTMLVIFSIIGLLLAAVVGMECLLFKFRRQTGSANVLEIAEPPGGDSTALTDASPSLQVNEPERLEPERLPDFIKA